MRTLLIDNYDSYTFNLHQLIAITYGIAPCVVRHDDASLNVSLARRFDAIVVSPGPGRPQRPTDVGRCLDIIRDSQRPVLGVCLGHQAIGYLSGASVRPAPRPRHGHLTRVRHRGEGLFAGVPQDFTAVRYHSLCVMEPLPAELVANAWAEDDVIMSLRHRTHPWYGVQFHPESVASEFGAHLLRNFRTLVGPRLSGVYLGPKLTGFADDAFDDLDSADTASAGERHGGESSGVDSFALTDRLLLRHRRLPFSVDLERVFGRLFARYRYAFWLDSSRIMPGLSRFSFLGAPAGPCGEVLCYRVGTGRVDVLDTRGRPIGTEPGDVFDALQRRLDRHALPHLATLPFNLQGGYVGYLGYEMKADCGSPNRHTASAPDAVWMSASRYLVVDHQTGTTWVLALCRDLPDDVAATDGWLGEACAVAHLSRQATDRQSLDQRGIDRQHTDRQAIGLQHTHRQSLDQRGIDRWLIRTREEYLRDIQTCLATLRAGESYEICLTNEARVPFHGDPFGLYLRQRRGNPAPYAAFLRLGDQHLLCSSPERFLTVDATGVVESKPIKGTAPRDDDPLRDELSRAELLGSAKTRAENLMIVDLLRNDLGQVCETGSVYVPSFMAVESYATVHQLVSTVRGRRRPTVPTTHVVRACFPGGSMTGAPKLRTMRIIGAVEDRPRGAYSGALGFFGLTGPVDLNIIIRTIVAHDGMLRVGAGGAIVLDSDPEAEFEEMRLKLAAPLSGVFDGVTQAPAVS